MTAKSLNLLPNKVMICQRDRSARWQARIKLKSGEWHRFTTGTRDDAGAREAALKLYYTADYKEQNKLPQSTRKFAAVAQYAHGNAAASPRQRTARANNSHWPHLAIGVKGVRQSPLPPRCPQ